jgi:hypothetical protein
MWGRGYSTYPHKYSRVYRYRGGKKLYRARPNGCAIWPAQGIGRGPEGRHAAGGAGVRKHGALDSPVPAGREAAGGNAPVIHLFPVCRGAFV